MQGGGEPPHSKMCVVLASERLAAREIVGATEEISCDDR